MKNRSTRELMERHLVMDCNFVVNTDDHRVKAGDMLSYEFDEKKCKLKVYRVATNIYTREARVFAKEIKDAAE